MYVYISTTCRWDVVVNTNNAYANVMKIPSQKLRFFGPDLAVSIECLRKPPNIRIRSIRICCKWFYDRWTSASRWRWRSKVSNRSDYPIYHVYDIYRRIIRINDAWLIRINKHIHVHTEISTDASHRECSIVHVFFTEFSVDHCSQNRWRCIVHRKYVLHELIVCTLCDRLHRGIVRMCAGIFAEAVFKIKDKRKCWRPRVCGAPARA